MEGCVVGQLAVCLTVAAEFAAIFHAAEANVAVIAVKENAPNIPAVIHSNSLGPDLSGFST